MIAIDHAARERERAASLARIGALLELLWEIWAGGNLEAGPRIVRAATLYANISGDRSKLIQASRLLGVTEDEQHD